ncbi:IS3 family transposase [Streptomyces sp. SAS_272]|uniref:IS3 family transposase n=1 Tax=Streptomyces sp. SAS_272 TaxID=3412747 RepID=UPI00403CA9E4
MARCRFIDAEKASEGDPAGHSVAFLCRVLGVPRSTYYAHRASRPARAVRERAEELLVDEIRVLHAGSRGAYGAPRVHAALRRAGRVVNSKKIERLMRKHRIVGITRRRRRGLTRQAKRAVFALDLIGRDFTAPRPGMRLVGDMTELSTLEGKLYLATCIDLATREVVGWAMADHHRAELPVAALRMAAGRGGLEQGCVMYSADSTGRRNTLITEVCESGEELQYAPSALADGQDAELPPLVRRPIVDLGGPPTSCGHGCGVVHVGDGIGDPGAVGLVE